jgi:YegS/Rv2252/BmrU family lipid kinase
MKTSSIYVVVNPTAGSGRAKNIAEFLIEEVRHLGVADAKLKFTKAKGDATTITSEAIIKGATMIIAVGGDGTVNEVVNGFFQNNNKLNQECELGIINCGTGGGLAGSLKMPRKIEKQIERIFTRNYVGLDLGKVTYTDTSGKSESRLFINECQTGIGSKVASVVGKKHKLLGGALAFGITATLQAIKIKPLQLNISYDDEQETELALIGLVIGNGTECAGGMKLTPDASLTDGYFDVLSIHTMNTAQRLFNLSRVYSGSHIHSPHFSVRRCKKINVRSQNIVSLEADGEMLGYSPFTVEIIPAAIRIKA